MANTSVLQAEKEGSIPSGTTNYKQAKELGEMAWIIPLLDGG